MLGLAVAVCVRAVGRADGDPDREEGQQRGDEVHPECSASEMSPRLFVASPGTSLSAMSAAAAPTEMSAVRRCGFMREG